MKVEGTRGNKVTTVRGILVAVDWDDNGTAIAVELSGNDEKQYLIDNHGKQKELLKFIQKEMEVSGMVRAGNDGKKIMTLKRYKVF